MNNYSFEIITICRTVENYFNLPSGYIQIKTRKREIVQARQIAMWFAKDITRLSLVKIGEFLGEKHHATVLNAIKTVNNLVETDKIFRDDFNEIYKRLHVDAITKDEIHEAINKAMIQRFAKVIQWKNIYKSML